MKKSVILIFICTLLTSCQGVSPTFSEKATGWGFRRTEKGPEFTQNQITEMSEYKCIYKETTSEKSIYLTFDEGYENGYTPLILDTLREKGVCATFFVTAPYVKENPDIIKRMIKEGHIVGNHTKNHPSLPEVSDEDFEKELFELDRLIWGITKTSTKYLRPPKGEYSARTLSLSHSLGYTNVFWSDAFVDWNNNFSAQEAHRNITKNLHPGEVLLLHAVSKGNADALSDIIDTARKEGYSFKSLDEYKFE